MAQEELVAKLMESGRALCQAHEDLMVMLQAEGGSLTDPAVRMELRAVQSLAEDVTWLCSLIETRLTVQERQAGPGWPG